MMDAGALSLSSTSPLKPAALSQRFETPASSGGFTTTSQREQRRKFRLASLRAIALPNRLPPSSEPSPSSTNPHRPLPRAERKERPSLPSGHASPDWSHHLPAPSHRHHSGREQQPASLPPPRQPVPDRHVSAREAGVDEVWLRVRKEARQAAESEPFLASYMYAAILAHPSMEGALAFHLANKLANPTLLSTQLKDLFAQVLVSDIRVQDAIRADLQALESRDPACLGLAHGMLYFKGYLALQTYRIAHQFWIQGREGLALALANRISEIFHVEIHPAARIGKGILLDHATGVVVGETAFVGDNVSILHDVTLGGTGCTVGLRHPQVESGVLIGAGAKLLGPITIGAGSKIGACSVVLEDIPPNSTVVGNPGRVVGGKQGSATPMAAAPSETMDHADFADWVI